MPDERTTGIILRTRLLTETSLIVHWLTPDLGRIATVAKGARRPKSAFRGKLDLFYLADFSFGRSARSDLHTLREVVLRETHSKLRQDLTRLEQACYASNLVEQTTETGTPLPVIFEMVLGFLRAIAAESAGPTPVLALELKLLGELGLTPGLDEARLSPGARLIGARLAADDWEAISRLKLSAAQTREIGQFLHGFMIYHLGKLPRGRAEAVGL